MNEQIVNHIRNVLGIGEEDVPVIYESFLTTFSECVDKLRAAVDPPDFLAIRAATHMIVGFARNVGAEDLGEAAAALNAAAHAADARACACGVAEICEFYDRYTADDAVGATEP